MKKIQQTFIISILLLPLSLFGQDTTSFTIVGKSFTDIRAHYFKQVESEPEDSKKLKQFNRWDWFWGARADQKATPGHSPYATIGNAMSDFMAMKSLGQINWCEQQPEGFWCNMGPFGTDDLQTNDVPGTQTNGRVDAVWLDPSDNNHALVGGFAGGLWETHDLQSATPAWKNITDADNSFIPGSMGINDICIESVGANISGPVYLSTSLGNHFAEPWEMYGLGLITSPSLSNPTWTQDAGFVTAFSTAFNTNPNNGVTMPVQFVEYCPRNATPSDKRIFAAVKNRLFLKVNNDSWQEVDVSVIPKSPNWPNLNEPNKFNDIIIDIAFDPLDRNHMWLTTVGLGYHGYDRNGMLIEMNATGGGATPTWNAVDITGTLPDIFANAVNFLDGTDVPYIQFNAPQAYPTTPNAWNSAYNSWHNLANNNANDWSIVGTDLNVIPTASPSTVANRLPPHPTDPDIFKFYVANCSYQLGMHCNIPAGVELEIYMGNINEANNVYTIVDDEHFQSLTLTGPINTLTNPNPPLLPFRLTGYLSTTAITARVVDPTVYNNAPVVLRDIKIATDKPNTIYVETAPSQPAPNFQNNELFVAYDAWDYSGSSQYARTRTAGLIIPAGPVTYNWTAGLDPNTDDNIGLWNYYVNPSDHDRQFITNVRSNSTTNNWATPSNNNPFGNDAHDDTRCFAFGTTADNGEEVFAGTDGGPLYRPYNGAYVGKSGNYMSLGTFYGISDPDIGNGRLVGNQQDNGVEDWFPDDNNTYKWRQNRIGDSYESYFDKRNQNIAYAKGNNDLFIANIAAPFGNTSTTSLIWLNLVHTLTGEQQPPDFKLNTNNTKLTSPHIIVPWDASGDTDPTDGINDQNVYCGWSRIWRWDDVNNNWVDPYPDPTAPTNNNLTSQPRIYTPAVSKPEFANLYKAVRAFAINKNNADEVYVAYNKAGADENFYKRVNTGTPLAPNWKFEDRTPPDVKNHGLRISDIAVDPLNFDRVWVSLENIYSTWAGGIQTTEDEKRVLFSADGGINWQDISNNNGLSALPVNCIEYQNGSDDILYIGTDAGIYRWEKATQSWKAYNRLATEDREQYQCIAPMIVTDLEINYCQGELYAGTWGRGVWKSPLYYGFDRVGPAYIVNQDETWSEDRILDGGVLVRAGRTLTITGTANPFIFTSTTTINMPKKGRIMVEPGARLIIDGAKITSACNDRWDGIYVFGDPSTNQVPFLNNNQLVYSQGFCDIKNNAILEFAENALTNYGGPQWDSPDGTAGTGGIINAENAIFLNNKRSVEFLQYKNMISNQQAPDASQFINCRFITNDLAYENRYPYFWAHMSMWAVRGVRVEGCRFDNITSPVTMGADRHSAIVTLDASYVVKDASTYGTTFKGFNTAIESNNSSLRDNGIHPIVIRDAAFDRNRVGVKLGNMQFPSVLYNDFSIGNTDAYCDPQTPAWFQCFGSKLENVSNFAYCSNSHTKGVTISAPCLDYNIGTYIRNAGTANQRVLSNGYGFLDVGNIATETNGLSKPQVSGLNYMLNTNMNNVRADFQLYNTIVRSVQNDMTVANNACMNEFSSSANCRDWFHQDLNNRWSDYWHSGQAQQVPQVPLSCSLLLKGVPLTVPTCEEMPHRPNGVNLTTGEIAQLENDYSLEEASYNQNLALLNQLIDDGDTDGTETDIENSTTADQMQIRQEMLARSPYVSQEVLRTLAKENILSTAILFEIIMANPDASRQEGFIDFIQYEAPNPLPAYMISMIEQSWNGATARATLENNIGAALAQMTKMRNEILVNYGSNPNVQDQTQLVYWLQKVPNLRNRYHLIEHYLYEANYALSDQLLASIPADYKLREDEQEEYNQYVLLYNFKKSIFDSDRDVNALTEQEQTQLISIADYPKNSLGRGMARAILCFFYNHCYPSDPVLEVNFSSNKAEIAPIMDKVASSILKVYPNPAKDHVSFELRNKKELCKECELIISDIQGRLVHTGSLGELNGLHIWDTRNMVSGTYVYKVKTNAGVETGKIILVK